MNFIVVDSSHRASDLARERFTCEADAERLLVSRGYRQTFNACWSLPDSAHQPDEVEIDALEFLTRVRFLDHLHS